MELSSLTVGMDALSGYGIVLSTERKASMAVSLRLLKNAEKFARVYYWGTISAGNREYIIAQGVDSNIITSKKSFYSTDGLTWAQLPQVHPMIQVSTAYITQNFTGNPSYEYTVNEKSSNVVPVPQELASIRKQQPNDDGGISITTVITEEKRLAATIARIDFEAAIVPRGAFCLSLTGVVETNQSFTGLSLADSGKQNMYQHARTAVNVSNKTLLERSKMDQSFDFLDPISEDIPKGVWRAQYDRSAHVAVIRNLLWPGFVAYHQPASPKFGYVYHGNGCKNGDICFMLP